MNPPAPQTEKCYPLPVNFAWSQIKTTVSSKLAPFKKYKWRILAVTVLLVIFLPVAVVTYLSNREQNLYMDDDQRTLGIESESISTAHYSVDSKETYTDRPYYPISEQFPKYYKVVLESIDDVQGTAHLRAELKMRTPDGGKGMPLLDFIDGRLKTDQTRRNPVPVEVLFGRFMVHDESEGFPFVVSIDLESKTYALPGPVYDPIDDYVSSGRPPNFSESAPTSAQADISLIGIKKPRWYPFDEYMISARVDCVVVATPDRKKYFRILSDGYTLASKLPNFIVRTPNANDMQNWMGPTLPDIKTKNLKERTKSTDFWRDGVILLFLKRPLFPRFFAGFFGIVALAWIAVVATVSDPKQLSLNVFGYFLALWAIRAALAAGAPTGPLFIDYVTLGLYALLIAVGAARFIWIRKT